MPEEIDEQNAKLILGMLEKEIPNTADTVATTMVTDYPAADLTSQRLLVLSQIYQK